MDLEIPNHRNFKHLEIGFVNKQLMFIHSESYIQYTFQVAAKAL